MRIARIELKIIFCEKSTKVSRTRRMLNYDGLTIEKVAPSLERNSIFEFELSATQKLSEDPSQDKASTHTIIVVLLLISMISKLGKMRICFIANIIVICQFAMF